MVGFHANKSKTPYEAMHNFDSLALAFSCNHASRNIAYNEHISCRHEGLTHMGPMEDPVKLASKITRSFNACRDRDTWAALPLSESIAVQDHSKL